MSTSFSGIVQMFESLFGLESPHRSLNHLETIVSRFSAVPYENLTKIIRASNEIEPEKRLRQPMDVLRDFSQWGTGGTCFSLTWCLREILTGYGYSSDPRMADLGNRECNHCALVVDFDHRPFLLDPGYLITRPLPIPASGSVVHETALYPVLLEQDRFGDGLNLSTLEPGGAKYRYRLHGSNCERDQFIQYWIDSFSWTMMNSLLVSRVTPNGRLYLHDRHVRWFNRDGHHSDKLKDSYDDHVALQTGIHKNIVISARSILAESKRSLKV